MRKTSIRDLWNADESENRLDFPSIVGLDFPGDEVARCLEMG